MLPDRDWPSPSRTGNQRGDGEIRISRKDSARRIVGRLARERADALFVNGDAFFNGRRVQLANLAVRDRIPAAYSQRDFPAVGGLMSYGTNSTDAWRQVGVYTGNILKGAKPAELPVQQAVKFDFVINRGTAILLGLDVPPTLLALATEVIE